MQTLWDVLRTAAFALDAIALGILGRLIVERSHEIMRRSSEDALSLLLIDVGLAVAVIQNVFVTIDRVGNPPQLFGVFLSLIWLSAAIVGLFFRRRLIVDRRRRDRRSTDGDENGRETLSRRRRGAPSSPDGYEDARPSGERRDA